MNDHHIVTERGDHLVFSVPPKEWVSTTSLNERGGHLVPKERRFAKMEKFQ